MRSPMFRQMRLKLAALMLSLFASAWLQAAAPELVISVKNQTMTMIRDGMRKEFQVSTSKFGLGDYFRSYRTPTGLFAIERKVGDRLPIGAVLKGLRFTGEIVAPNSPGRDPIVTRVLCLRGLDANNRNAATRGIYIHGTPDEKNIGKPASFGCIRMRSSDVVNLFDAVTLGTRVTITDVPRSYLDPKPDPRGDDWYK